MKFVKNPPKMTVLSLFLLPCEVQNQKKIIISKEVETLIFKPVKLFISSTFTTWHKGGVGLK